MGTGVRKRDDPLVLMRKAQAEAVANRKLLLERMRDARLQKALPQNRKTPDTSFSHLNIDAALAAASRLRLMAFDMGVGPATQLNRPTLDLVKEFLQTLVTGESAAVLQWPFGQRDVSLLHPLAMTTLLCTPERRTTNNFYWCEPAECFRALYFPWRGGATATTQASFLIRRNEIVEWNSYHLTRNQAGAQKAPDLLDRLHITLGHLDRLKQRETSKPHLANPSLAEIYPVFVADSPELQTRPYAHAEFELFGRVRYGAALDQLIDHRPALSVPANAPFAFFGISPRAKLKQALSASVLSQDRGLPPNICLLDLGPPAMSRLGFAWSETIEQFIAETNKAFPNLPVFAVTQDPFVHGRVAAMLRSQLKDKPRSRVIVRVTRDPLSNDPSIADVRPITATFRTVAGPAADAIAFLSEAARGSSDPAFAGLLRREMGSLRKAASLPCGLSAAYDILCNIKDQSTAETFLERRSRASLLAPIESALEGEVGGAERGRLETARAAVQRAFDALDGETPIGSLLSELIPVIVGKSSQSIVAFAGDMERLLAEHRFADDSEVGQRLRRRLDRGFITFATMDDLERKLSVIERGPGKNSCKRLVLIAPNLDWLSSLAAHSWLPESIIIVCERNIASRIADTFRRLSTHPDLSGSGNLGDRLAQLAAAAKRELEARAVSSVDLEFEPSLDTSAEETFIDLTDEDVGDETELVLLSLASNRTLRARPGQIIIRYNPQAEINPFERATAREIRPGTVLVVPDSAFIEEARDALPIRVLAQSWLDVYHTTVAAQLPGIAGDSLSAKARTILSEIRKRGAKTQSQGAVQGWLRVDEYLKLPPDQRQPHAPQAQREFRAFMAALAVNDALTEKMWLEGIQPLRKDRRRAGQRMAQAFVSVLVDPHGTASGLDASVRDGIRVLRKKAMDHLDQVIATKIVQPGDHHG
jgi:hypothetical protein